jgi:hypothetical protein
VLIWTEMIWNENWHDKALYVFIWRLKSEFEFWGNLGCVSGSNTSHMMFMSC